MYREHSVDCVVLPSLDEGLSVALVEAMAHGVPVVATAVGGVPELLEGDAGVLVPPRDAEALADALASVLGSPERRAHLARAGRRRVETEFDVEAIARELATRFGGNSPVERAG
jgi:glycosyltransferase involved in cell wall biosynthesis